MSETGRRSKSNEPSAPVLLPPQIAPSEDLTWQARRSPFVHPAPFDGDPLAERLFDSIIRALHRREYPNALLVGERGVGTATYIAELARRAANDVNGFLATKKLLTVDCRHTVPDEARARLSAVLAHTGPYPDLIVCLDGLHGLLCKANCGSNKPV